MNTSSASTLLKSVGRTLSKHSPGILIGIGIGGMAGAGVLAVRATPKAIAKIEKTKREERKDELKLMEIVKVTWKCYIPAATTFVVSAGCILGANSVHTRRNAALATAYKLSETVLTEYREKTLETIGERKEKEIRDKVAKHRLEQNPVNKTEVFMTNKGNTLCFDPLSARHFKTDIEKIRRAVNEINENILNSPFGEATLNDFYDELGLERTQIGDELGWNATYTLRLDFSSQLNENGEPELVLDYITPPRHGYQHM